MAGEHAGHRQRMRDRFLANGLDGFAPHEVLELMLFYAIPRRNVNPLAHRLIDHFGSLNAVLNAPVEMLKQVEGMGDCVATLVHLFQEVGRLCANPAIQERENLGSRGAAKQHCIRFMQGLRQEHFGVVCLDGQMNVIRDEIISRGTINEVSAYPRLVVEAVLRHNAHTVVLCHNHPGGSVIPSQQDVESTRQLAAVLAAIDVVMADHMIVADGEALSMAACGLITLDFSQGSPVARVADSAGEVLIRHQLMKKQKEKK